MLGTDQVSAAASEDEALRKWREIDAEPAEQIVRTRYLDAVRAALRPGLSKAEVETLLGAPTRRFDSEWVYIIQVNLPFTWEYDYLVVRFADGRFSGSERVNSEVYTDPPGEMPQN